MDAILHAKADVLLSSGLTLHLTDEEILSDGFRWEDATSGENSFDVVSAIINSHTLRFSNVGGYYDQYDFDLAEVVPYVGIEEDGRLEWKKKGVYTVDSASRKESSVTLECLDDMAKFDRPYYESGLIYPATLLQIVKDACQACGVTFDGVAFDNSSYIVQVRPAEDALTFRAMISYAAQLAGCYARCDENGRLGFRWYDFSPLEAGADGGIFDTYRENVYMTGDPLDGGNFLDYSSGDSGNGGFFETTDDYHHIYDLSSQDVNTGDVVVTGFRVSGVEKENKSYFDATAFYENVYASVRQQMTKSPNAVSFTLPISPWAGDAQSHIWCDLHGYLPPRQSYRLDFDVSGDLSGTVEVCAEASAGDEIIGSAELKGTGHYAVEFELTTDHEYLEIGTTWPYLYFWIDNKAGKKITLSNFSIQKTEADEVERSALYGSEGYVLSVSGNPLVTAATVNAIASSVGPKLVGARFRPLSVSAVPDPRIKAGDPAIVSDRLGRAYPTILTNVSFAIGAYEKFSCGAETTGENIATRYTTDTKTGVLVTEDTKKLMSERDSQLQKLFDLLVGVFGLFRTETITGKEAVEYVHDKPELANSTYIWKYSSSGFTVSRDGGKTYEKAIDASGKAILNALDVIGK